MLNLDPYLLRAFLSVAEVGTVNGAAVSLHRTQAAVSMQIRKLEALVGSDLFERSPKGLTLTADGLLLVPYAREILTLTDEVGKRLNGRQIEGRIRLGVVEDFAATRLIDILRDFRDKNARVDIDILVESNARLAAMLENDELDIAVCDTSRCSRKPMHVWNEYLHWVGRADIEFTPDMPLPVIMFVESCPWRGPAMATLATRNRNWRIVCEASTLVAMATAVRVGIGIGPMIAATIPEGCRALDKSIDMPGSARVDIGLYVRSGAREESRFLADFVLRQVELGHA